MGFLNSNTTKRLKSHAILSGLTHDIGKADPFFQERLNRGNKAENKTILFRHEQWSAWLNQNWILTSYFSNTEQIAQQQKWESVWSTKNKKNSTFSPTGAWLGAQLAVLTHHKQPDAKDNTGYLPLLLSDPSNTEIKKIDIKLTQPGFSPWAKEIQKIKNNSDFYEKLDMNAAILADARQALMMADHTVSSRNLSNDEKKIAYAGVSDSFKEEWSLIKANSIPNNKRHSPQKRSEAHELLPHLMAVGKEAGEMLEKIRNPQLLNNGIKVQFEDGVSTDESSRFFWQKNMADFLKLEIQNHLFHQPDKFYSGGAFGIIAADTGAGKTIGAVKALQALYPDQQALRWNLLLGLRTLTEQSGRAYQKILQLNEDNMAVVMGDKYKGVGLKNDNPLFGHEEEQEWEVWAYHQENLQREDGWGLGVLTESKTNQVILNAPVLVATIDQLMKAANTQKSKHLLAQMRLRFSDTIIDEIDSFSPQDWPALTRLCSWIGLLGGKLLIVSATAPTKLVDALLKAYTLGYQQRAALEKINPEVFVFASADRGHSSTYGKIMKCQDILSSEQKDESVYEKAIKQWQTESAKSQFNWTLGRRLEIQKNENYETILAANWEEKSDKTLLSWKNVFLELHEKSHTQILCQENNQYIQKRLSFGLVRIDDTEIIAKTAFELASKWQDETQICIVAYHANLVREVRREIEQRLDEGLKLSKTWREPKNVEYSALYQAIQKNESETAFLNQKMKESWNIDLNAVATDNLKNFEKIQDILVIVIASPVEEVGRDHDFDWAILEPQTPGGLIQSAGRVFRHRPLPLPQEVSVIDVLPSLMKSPLVFENESTTLKRKNIPNWKQFLATTPLTLEKNQWLKNAQGHHMKVPMEGNWIFQSQEIWNTNVLKCGTSYWRNFNSWVSKKHPECFPFRDNDTNISYFAQKKDKMLGWYEQTTEGEFQDSKYLDYYDPFTTKNKSTFLNLTIWNKLIENNHFSFELKFKEINEKIYFCPYLGKIMVKHKN